MKNLTNELLSNTGMFLKDITATVLRSAALDSLLPPELVGQTVDLISVKEVDTGIYNGIETQVTVQFEDGEVRVVAEADLELIEVA